jgi:hypothetical protein
VGQNLARKAERLKNLAHASVNYVSNKDNTLNYVYNCIDKNTCGGQLKKCLRAKDGLWAWGW